MPSPKKEFKVDTLRSFDKADLFKQKLDFIKAEMIIQQ
jgi:hypothetical protein